MEEFFENELAKKFEEMIENNEETYFDTEELEDIVIHYLEMGDVEFAEQAVNYGLKLHPDSYEMKTKQLEVFLELENYVEAKKLIRELRDAGTEDTDFLVCCAKYYSNLGNSKRAIEYCQTALGLKEEENFLHNFIGDEFINLEDPFSALKHYKLALIHDSQDDYSLENIMMCYSRLNKPKEALEFLNSYLDEFPYSETAWFEYGQFFFNKKNYKEAIRGFDYILAINSTSLGVYSNKAACFEALKEWQKAIDVYNEMLEHEFTKAYTYYRIGLCYKALGKSVEALKYFQDSLSEDPQFYLSMMEQSQLYEEMGAKKEALFFAKNATSLNENNLDFQKRLAYLYIESGYFDESLSCLEKICAQEPDRFYNWYAYSEVLILVEDFDKAISVISKAIQHHKRAELYYQMSHCFSQKNDAEAARIALANALALNPEIFEDMQSKYPLKSSGKDKKTTRKK